MRFIQKNFLLTVSIGCLLVQLLACAWLPLPNLLHLQGKDGFGTPPSIAASTPTGIPTGTPTDTRPDSDRLRELLDREDIQAAVEEIEAGWKKNYEDYYERDQAAPLMSLEAIATVLAENNRQTNRQSALIYAVPTSQALELILLTAEGAPLHIRRRDAPKDQLTQTIQRFRRAIVDSRTTSEAYLPPAQQLYQWLIAPLGAALQLHNIDTLIFCLGADLRSTPLAALHDGQAFLVEQYSIAIIPAFSLLDQHPTPLQNTRVLAMGSSQFQSLSPLPAVPVELSMIAQHLWQGEERLNQQFTVANLTEERSKYPYGIVHLATHAEFTPGAAHESYIQFWDQRLPLSQLGQLNLQSPVVQLLVLSACRTALGDKNAELGFAGLAVQSGTQAAIASLWSVSDVGTLVLMSELYQQLKTTPIKAEALQTAQITLLNQEADLSNSVMTRMSQSAETTLHAELEQFDRSNLSHPYYWAAFTLIGNPW